jgi:hypothetical protein
MVELWPGHEGGQLQDPKGNLTAVIQKLRNILDQTNPRLYIERADSCVQFIYRPVLTDYKSGGAQSPDGPAKSSVSEGLLDRLIQLSSIRERNGEKYFHSFIDPLYRDAEQVARDYMLLFAELVHRLSEAEHPDEVIEWLEERRTAFQPVRMKIRAFLDVPSTYDISDPTQRLVKGLWGLMKGTISFLEEGHGLTREYGFGGHTVLDMMKRLKNQPMSAGNRERFIDHARGQQMAIERAWEDVVRGYAKIKIEVLRG